MFKFFQFAQKPEISPFYIPLLAKRLPPAPETPHPSASCRAICPLPVAQSQALSK